MQEREALRIAAVRRYAVLDTPPDGAFDRIAALAARLFDVPIAIVSIVDSDRIWFKSHHGIDLTELGRDPGLCASAIMDYQPWIVNDARLDERALANPLVAGEFGLRFYAGAPLTTHDGYNLGTLCVIDKEPREVSEEEARTLSDLAALVVDDLELRLTARTGADQAAQRLREVEDLAQALQASLLPPALPQIAGVELAAKYHAANRFGIGGDFYDVFPVHDVGWGVAIGDVCGKGPQAAGLASATRHSIRTAAIDGLAPAGVLRVVNQALLATSEADTEPRFVTAVFARVEPQPDRALVRFAVAGHPLPTILRANGEVIAVGSPGSLLGVVDDVDLTDTVVELLAGDTLVLLTDGVLDSGAPDRLEREGFERLLAKCAGLSAQAIVDRIHRAVADAQRDDIAILAITPEV